MVPPTTGGTTTSEGGFSLEDPYIKSEEGGEVMEGSGGIVVFV